MQGVCMVRSLPLSPVYFMFPRNISLSVCVVYGRLNICGQIGDLNPSLLYGNIIK